MEPLLLVLLFEALLGPDGENVIVHSNLDIVLAHPRQFGRNADLVLRLRDIHVRRKEAFPGGSWAAWRHPAKGVLKEAVHVAVKGLERVPPEETSPRTEGSKRAVAHFRSPLALRLE